MADDPTATLVVESLAHPGRNVTGIASLRRSLAAKRLELLHQIAPSTHSVGVLVGGPYEPAAGAGQGRMGVYDAGGSLGMQVTDVVLSGEVADLASTLGKATQRGIDAFIVPGPQSYASKLRREIAAYALEQRIPLAAEEELWTEAGALLALGADPFATFRRLAVFVDRILKGTKPGDIPIEQPLEYEMTVNVGTARAIGVTIPQAVLARATRVVQ